MNLKACALAIFAFLVFGWAFASPGDLVDLGAGLLLRPDGTVVAAWELPGCELTADAFDAPDVATGFRASRDAWQVRLDRGW